MPASAATYVGATYGCTGGLPATYVGERAVLWPSPWENGRFVCFCCPDPLPIGPEWE